MPYDNRMAEVVKSSILHDASDFQDHKKRAGAKKKDAATPKKEKEPKGPKPWMRYARAMMGDRNLRVGGPTGDADGRVDETIYRWEVTKQGAAWWRIVHPRTLESHAQAWLEAHAEENADDRGALRCVATLTNRLMADAAYVPAPNKKLNLVPLQGKYLLIEDDGRIVPVEPEPRYGMTYGIEATCDESKIDKGEYQPKPVNRKSHFGRYLDMTFVNDEVRDYVCEALATVLINRCFERSVWMYGDGENGKSVMIHIMTAVVGGRAAPIKLGRLTRDQFGTVALHGARLATVAEVPKVLTGEMQDTLKELISWDAQPLERKGRDAFTFRPNAVWLLASNAFPRVSQNEHGFWRKIITAPFTRRVPEEAKKQDFHTLITGDSYEMSQVIDWLLAGAQRLIRRGGKFAPAPEAIAALGRQQRLVSDPVVAFLDDHEVQHDTTVWTSKQEIYNAYCEFCDRDNRHPLAADNFWSGVRAQLRDVPDLDLEGKRGPATGQSKTRQRYVQLKVVGVDALRPERVPQGWGGAVASKSPVVVPLPVARQPVRFSDAPLNDTAWDEALSGAGDELF